MIGGDDQLELDLVVGFVYRFHIPQLYKISDD